MKYDTVVLLSHKLNPDGSMTSQGISRLNGCVDLYRKNIASTITVSGNYTRKRYDNNNVKDSDFYIYIKDYLISKKNIPSKNVFLEMVSLDTIGNAVFTKKDIVLPNGWKKLIILSNDYHMNRVKKIFNFVFGDGYELLFYGVKTDNNDIYLRTPEEEEDSLQFFLRNFKDVKAGDDARILERLYKFHSLYKK